MKSLLILSGKGGTGKTTIASAFIKLSNAKAYADCDVDAPNLHLVMKELSNPVTKDYYGLDKAQIDTSICIECGRCLENCRFDAISYNKHMILDYFACEGCGVCQAICPVKAVTLEPAKAGDLMLYKNSFIFSTATLKMGSGNSGLLVTEVKKQLDPAKAYTEIAIIDGSPGIGCPVIASLSGVDTVLVVAEPSISGISDMKRIIKTAKGFGVKIAICINKYNSNLTNTEKIVDYCQSLGLPIVGKIPFDKKAIEAVNQGATIADIDSLAGDSVKLVFTKTLKILCNEI